MSSLPLSSSSTSLASPLSTASFSSSLSSSLPLSTAPIHPQVDDDLLVSASPSSAEDDGSEAASRRGSASRVSLVGEGGTTDMSGGADEADDDEWGEDDEEVGDGPHVRVGEKRKRARPWTSEEDELVMELVRRHGGSAFDLATVGPSGIRWLEVGSQVAHRTGKQCRERWHNLLNPHVKKLHWSADEDAVIVEALKTIGTKWAEIAKSLPGRTDNAIKNSRNRSVSSADDSGALFQYCLSVNGRKDFGPDPAEAAETSGGGNAGNAGRGVSPALKSDGSEQSLSSLVIHSTTSSLSSTPPSSSSASSAVLYGLPFSAHPSTGSGTSSGAASPIAAHHATAFAAQHPTPSLPAASAASYPALRAQQMSYPASSVPSNPLFAVDAVLHSQQQQRQSVHQHHLLQQRQAQYSSWLALQQPPMSYQAAASSPQASPVGSPPFAPSAAFSSPMKSVPLSPGLSSVPSPTFSSPSPEYLRYLHAQQQQQLQQRYQQQLHLQQQQQAQSHAQLQRPYQLPPQSPMTSPSFAPALYSLDSTSSSFLSNPLLSPSLGPDVRFPSSVSPPPVRLVTPSSTYHRITTDASMYTMTSGAHQSQSWTGGLPFQSPHAPTTAASLSAFSPPSGFAPLPTVLQPLPATASSGAFAPSLAYSALSQQVSVHSQPQTVPSHLRQSPSLRPAPSPVSTSLSFPAPAPSSLSPAFSSLLHSSPIVSASSLPQPLSGQLLTPPGAAPAIAASSSPFHVLISASAASPAVTSAAPPFTAPPWTSAFASPASAHSFPASSPPSYPLAQAPSAPSPVMSALQAMPRPTASLSPLQPMAPQPLFPNGPPLYALPSSSLPYGASTPSLSSSTASTFLSGLSTSSLPPFTGGGSSRGLR